MGEDIHIPRKGRPKIKCSIGSPLRIGFVMLYEEAKFIGKVMHALDPNDVFPLLNLGSSSDELAKQRQPWIDEYIFSKARASNLKVVNVDLKANPGVDIVRDVTDPAFLEELKTMGFKSIICSNMLEHVPTDSVERICESLQQIIPKDGYLFISGPYKFPYHPDPIDTMFRPNVELFNDGCINCLLVLFELFRRQKRFPCSCCFAAAPMASAKVDLATDKLVFGKLDKVNKAAQFT